MGCSHFKEQEILPLPICCSGEVDFVTPNFSTRVLVGELWCRNFCRREHPIPSSARLLVGMRHFLGARSSKDMTETLEVLGGPAFPLSSWRDEEGLQRWERKGFPLQSSESVVFLMALKGSLNLWAGALIARAKTGKDKERSDIVYYNLSFHISLDIMWLDIISPSNRASRDGNGNSLCKHLEALKPLSTSGIQQGKGQLKFPAQALLTAEVGWRHCLLGLSFRVMRWHSHRNQEALEKLPAVTKSIGQSSNSLGAGHGLMGHKRLEVLAAAKVPVVQQELGLGPDNMARICVTASKLATLSPVCLILVEHQATVRSSAGL